MNSSVSQKIPAYQVLQYVILAWFILKRRVLEELCPHLDDWQKKYNVTHVKVGLQQGDLATMWSDMWSESEKVARLILGDNAEKQIEPSEFPREFNHQVLDFFDQVDWVKSDYLWLEILHPYFEDLIYLVVEIRNEIFKDMAYEPLDSEKAADLIARFCTNSENEQWEEFVLQAIVVFLQEAYCFTNRERGENELTPSHLAIFTREATIVMRGVSFV